MADLFDFTGLDTVRQRLAQLPAVMLAFGVIAIDNEDEAILDASQPLVPVDTGSLQRSGKIDQAVIQGTLVEGGVRYGGTVGVQGRIPERYCILVHEDVTMNHPRGGQSHYLSAPALAATHGMLERIADQLRNAL